MPYSPERVDEKERIVERRFLRIVFEGEEDGVAEPRPADEAQPHKAVASRALVDVQDLAGVEKLKHTARPLVKAMSIPVYKERNYCRSLDPPRVTTKCTTIDSKCYWNSISKLADST